MEYVIFMRKSNRLNELHYSATWHSMVEYILLCQYMVPYCIIQRDAVANDGVLGVL